MREIVDGIYACDDGSNRGNYGAIVLDDEVVMIDSGMIHSKSAEARTYLESKSGLPIRKLVFTHSHGDHVFGAQAFEPVTQICSEQTYNRIEQSLQEDWQISTLRQRYEEIKNEQPEMWNAIQSLKIRLPDITFDQSITLGDKGEITMKHLGGHTSGSSIVISHQQNAVFIGDLIFNGTFPYGGDPTCDPDKWILALEEVHSHEFSIIVPGHGSVCGQNELASYIEALSELRDNVKDAINTGLSIESFTKRGLIPDAIKVGFDRFGVRTLPHWFKFYR
jgi:cyclase